MFLDSGKIRDAYPVIMQREDEGHTGIPSNLLIAVVKPSKKRSIVLASINLDRAYCRETQCVLTIYQVRDLHFDEDIAFNARTVCFECPDEDCNAPLVGVNHANAEFKNTPHFRLLTRHAHTDACDYDGAREKKDNEQQKGKGSERNHKVSDYPEVLLLERQPVPFGTGKPKKVRTTVQSSTAVDNLGTEGSQSKTSPHETSCLEHVVETWLSNDPEDLLRSALTIGNKTKWYRNAFKPIKFFADEEGLIYWGSVKSIKKYGKAYDITFTDRLKVAGEPRKTSIYIPDALIERYRKRKLFRHYIESLIDRTDIRVTCYFVGAYPTLKPEEVVGEYGNFRPLEVHLLNLDHLVLRFDVDGEDL